MLKIYKHVKAQAQIKVKTGQDKDGKATFTNVRFTNGRTLGTEVGVAGGRFETTIEPLQKAIEERPDYGKMFFIDHKLEAQKAPSVNEKDYKVFSGVDTINSVKNILKTEFTDLVKGEDLRGTEEMLKCATRVGAAFPDFFKVDQGHFAEAKVEEKKVVKEEIKEEKSEDPLTIEKKEEEQQYEEVEVDPEVLKAMLRKDLDEKAKEFGVENPEKFANKDEVIEAILNQK